MKLCQKKFIALSDVDKKDTLEKKMNEYYETKHKNKKNPISSAHKAKIQDIRSRKPQKQTFSHTDPNAVKYMCEKKGVERFDIIGIDHFPDNTTVSVKTPYNDPNAKSKDITIASKTGSTPKDLETIHYKQRFGKNGKDRKKGIVNLVDYRWLGKKSSLNWKTCTYDDILNKYSFTDRLHIKELIRTLQENAQEYENTYAELRKFHIYKKDFDHVLTKTFVTDNEKMRYNKQMDLGTDDEEFFSDYTNEEDRIP